MHTTHAPARRPGWAAGLVGAGLFLAGVAAGRAVDARPGDRLREATAYVPVTANDGRAFTDAEWQRALAPVLGRFGGATVGDPAEGYWLDGRACLHRERVRPVTVAFPPGREGELRAALLDLGRRFGQEAVYVRVGEPCAEVLAVPPAAGD